MPSLSPTMTSGTIVKWVKKEGDPIGAGDLICEVQTDKAIVGLELEEEGILAKIILPDDTQDIKVGTLIGLMVEEGQDWKGVEMPADMPSVTSPEQPKADAQVKEDHTHVEKGGHLLGPSVRNLMNLFAIDANAIKSSGPHNVILKGDVLRYIQDNKLKPKTATEQSSSKPSVFKTVTPPAEYTDIELSNMRKTIAKRLTQSKTTIPHSYMTARCLMNDVINARKELKQSGINVSVNDFIIKAAAIALKTVPQVNTTWNDTSFNIDWSPSVDISVAVATPNGLITPIVKNANFLDLETIGKTVKALAEKARDGKLQPNEFIGGSFSISNLGMFGITEFSAVINPPQTAILAIGSSQLEFDRYDQIKSSMTVTLSYDSRAIDEEVAAKFLEVFKKSLEDPALLQRSDGSDHRRLNALIA